MISPDKGNTEQYLKEIIKLAVPVRITVNGKIQIDDCKLLFRPKSEDLLIRIKGGKHPKSGTLSIACVHQNKVYVFNSRIVGTQKVNSRFAYLRINRPGEIARQERRKFSRATPRNSKPVRLKFVLEDNTAIAVDATDISGGGLSCVLPGNLVTFKPRDSFPMTMVFPTLGKVQTWVIVTSITTVLEMKKVAFSYSLMNEYAHSVITSYVATRQQENDRGESSSIKGKKKQD